MSQAQKENIFEKQKSFKTIEAKHAPRHLQIAIAENLGINTSGMLPSDEKIKSDETAGVKKEINLSEQLAIVSNDFDTQSSVLVKGVHDVQATMDRIWNSDRIRLIGKTVVVDNPLAINQPVTKLSSFDEKLSYNNYYLERDFVNIFNKLLSVKLTKGVSLDTNNEASFLIGSVRSTEDNILLVAHDFVSAKNPIIFVLLVPLSGYILIRAEEARFQFQKSKQFLSFCFIALLLSSMVLTPISISSSYSNKAYAEIDNNTGLLSKTASNSGINSNYTDIPVNFTVQSPIGNFSNINSSTIASLNPLPSTIMKVTPSDQISIDDVVTTNHASNVTNPVSKSAFDNSTFSENAVISDAVTVATSYHTSNATLSLSEEINITDTETTPYHTPNPTTILTEDMVITDIVSAVQHNTIPNATQSWQFGGANETKSVGDIELQKETNGTSLKLDGSGYLTQNINSTRNLSALTLSAWIKPDYSQGSPQFTVISKENTFLLAVNSIIPPSKIVVFSVFDGIKWQTVESNTAIPDEWTHLVATFTGSSIAIYVNGNLESTVKTSGVPTVAVNGKLTTKTVDSISSNADIVIGGYYNSLRATSNNKFSGLIKDVNLYDSLLTPSQILRIYEQNNTGTNTPVSNSSGIYNSTLVDQVSMIDTVNLALNFTLLNDTAIPVIPTLNKTKNSYLITENPEFQFQYFKDKDFMRIFKGIKASYKNEQHEQWKDQKKTISVQVTGPDGKTISLKSVFKELREGKYDIKLSSTRDAQPGLYTVKVTMIKDGKTFVTQDQYQWGLVSLNTQKSIYKPGEVANLTIVVLDNDGHSVCNATIVMNIHDPSSHVRTLTSNNGIMPNSECGLYNAQYATKSEGNYTVDITAQNRSGIATFNTSFSVQKSFAFDIVRTAASKIDPVSNPNSFNVRIDIQSFTNATSVTVKEYVPGVFRVVTDADVQTIGDTKVLTWTKNLIENKTFVEYSYSVPLQFPKLYALGPVEINYSGQVFKEARQWFVANDPPQSYYGGASGSFTTTSGSITLTRNANFQNNEFLLVGISSNGNSGVRFLNYTTGGACGSGSGTNIDSTGWTGTETNIGKNATLASGTSATAAVRTSIYGISTSGISSATFNVCLQTKAANTRTALTAVLVHGVDTTNPLGYATQLVQSSGTSISTSVRGEPNSVVFGVVEDSVNTAPAITTGTRILSGNGAFLGWGLGNNTAPGGGGSTTIAWNGWASATNALSLVELRGQTKTLTSESLSLGDTLVATKNPIMFDSATSASNSNSLTLPISLTVANNPDRMLVVTAGSEDGADPVDCQQTSVTDNGQSLTEAAFNNYDGAANECVSLWYLINPPVGVNNVVINIAGTAAANENNGGAMSLYHVYQTAPEATSTNAADPATTITTSITTLTNKDWVIDSVQSGNPAGAFIAGPGQKIRYDQNGAITTSEHAASTKEVDTAGLTSMKEDNANANRLVQVLAAFKRAPLTQSLNESLPLADSIVAKISTKSLTESLPLADSIVAKIKTKSLTESLPLADTISKSISKSVTESLSLADTISKSISKSLTESLPLADSIVAKITTKSLTESLPLADSIVAKISTKSLTESLPLADSIVAKISTKSLTESLPLADSIVAKISTKSLTESLPLAYFIVAKTTTKSLTESLPLADSIVAKTTTKSLTESLPLADSIVAKISTKSLTESLPLADSIVAKISTKSLTESLPLADSIVATISTKSLTESLPLADSIVAKISTKSLTESLPLADSIVAKISTKSLTESLPLDDTISATRDTSTSLTESLQLDDTVSATRDTSTSLTESLQLDDTVSATRDTSTSLTESLQLQATISAPRDTSTSLTESLHLEDTVSATRDTSTSLTESLQLDDTVSATRDTSTSLTESLQLDDTVSATRDTSTSLTESLQLDDTVSET